MRYKTLKNILEGVTLLYGVAIVVVARLWAPDILPLGWITPAFFFLYEMVFGWLLGRYEKMSAQGVVTTSLIMRGVKFLGVAVMMLVWVACALPAKNPFLLYTLGFYLLTSLFEGWVVTAYNKQKEK